MQHSIRASLRAHSHRAVQAALALTILGGALTTGFYILFNPSPMNTFNVFYAAAEGALEGEVVYATEFGLFVYTPITLSYFVPFAVLFDFPTALLVHRVLSVCAAFGYGLALAGFLDDRDLLSRGDRALVVACLTIGLYPIVVVVLGGIEIYLGILLGMGFVLTERGDDRAGGALWAVASLFKIFPALWGAYFLVTRRWNAVVGAVVTGVGATLAGVALFGFDAYRRYFESAAADRVRFEMFANGQSPDNEAVTPIRPLSQLFPNVDPEFWLPVIVAVVVVCVLYVYLKTPQSGLDDRANLLLVTVIAVEFVMPTSQDLDMYMLYGPLIVSLYAERNDAVRVALAGSMVVYTYNFGRSQLDAVSGFVGPRFNDVVMAVGDPVLSFASMPLYGMLAMFAVSLVRARIRGRGSSVVANLRGYVRDANP